VKVKKGVEHTNTHTCRFPNQHLIPLPSKPLSHP
jgi:hypothetical protein